MHNIFHTGYRRGILCHIFNPDDRRFINRRGQSGLHIMCDRSENLRALMEAVADLTLLYVERPRCQSHLRWPVLLHRFRIKGERIKDGAGRKPERHEINGNVPSCVVAVPELDIPAFRQRDFRYSYRLVGEGEIRETCFLRHGHCTRLRGQSETLFK